MPALPNDILLLVGEFLEDHHDRYSLIFVCRRFHDLFLGLVYRAASIRTCCDTQSFLRFVLKRPELARAVRSLHFDRWQDGLSTGDAKITGEDRNYSIDGLNLLVNRMMSLPTGSRIFGTACQRPGLHFSCLLSAIYGTYD